MSASQLWASADGAVVVVGCIVVGVRFGLVVLGASCAGRLTIGSVEIVRSGTPAALLLVVLGCVPETLAGAVVVAPGTVVLPPPEPVVPSGPVVVVPPAPVVVD